MSEQDGFERTRAPSDVSVTTVDDWSTGRADPGAGTVGDSVTERAGAAAQTAAETAKDEARSVVQTARDEAGAVVDEAKTQLSRLTGEVREQVRSQANTQHGRLVEQLRRGADELSEMSRGGDSPVRSLVGEVADRTRLAADYMADRGPDGLLADVQDFARRRPVVFLTAAAAAGFVAGRMAKGIAKAKTAGAGGRPLGPAATGTYVSGSAQWREPAAIPMQAMTATPPVAASGSYAESRYGQPGYAEPGYGQAGYSQPDVDPGYTDPLRTDEPRQTGAAPTDAERGGAQR
jgi:vacuolar-type H+-ATPase subunit H